jgi:hypothetical protein
MTSENNGTRYYECVDCGHAGDYGFTRQTHFMCQACGYDTVNPLTVEEIQEHPGLRIRFKEILKDQLT